LNLGESATIAELPKIESFLKDPTTEKVSGKEEKADEEGRLFNDSLKLALSMIRFRDQLVKANALERQNVIKAGLSDAKLADWVWSRYVRQAAAESGQTAGESKMAALQIRALGENLFPPDVIHYSALPHPANALFALGRSLDDLQLESARSQANLVLVLNVFRQKLGEELVAPLGAALLPYTGINVDKPIAMARWLAEGAPPGTKSAERSAIVLRVTDRTRFERTLMRFHQGSGDIEDLTNYFSGSVRFLPFLPAFLPLSAKALVDGALKPEKEKPLLIYSTVGETAWGGYSVKVVERRKVDEHGRIFREAAYLTYVDDAAILTPDLESLRDVLTRASSEQPNLGSNPGFNRIKGENAEAFYISNIMLLSADPGDKPLPENEIVRESGVLRVSNAAWENHFELQFAENDWLKPFVQFQPEELKSPRDLLPRNTVAYYLMNFDLLKAWNDWWPKRLKEDELKQLDSIWSLEFEKEVLPELGPECGMAILGLPDILKDEWEPPWAVFCRLKSEKLARALAEGKLLKGATGSQPTLIKHSSEDYFVAVQNNFLVFANSRKAISELNQAEKLASSRDFSRAAKRAPAGMVAFGGYSLEAAVAAIGDPGTDAVKAHQSAFISSLTSAFHSPNFYATATNKSVTGRLSLSLDREGRFSVGELASISNEAQLTYAQIEARGVPIQEQAKLSNLKLRVRVKAAGGIDRIGEDLNAKTQIVKKLSDRELELTVFPRRTEVKNALMLPVKGPEFAAFLQPSAEIRSDDKAVIEKAQSIAGNETDAWTVARKLADWTYKNIKWKVVDYATAPQTLATLEADCLEFSQLYVAMARSLGLPARVVSGMAYSGDFFGGHAWVEVFVGEWIEVDPTWGTDFVDATHIRNFANGELLTYAALNLVELEVLEAPTGVADFQKDVRSLAQKLCEELPGNVSTALTAAVDFAFLANGNSELGPWETLSDTERDLMTTSFRRVIESISSEFSKAATGASRLRLLAVKEDGEKAEAFVFQPGFAQELLKFYFVRRNRAWYLQEILRTDSGLYLIAEALQPTIKNLVERRTNKSARLPRTSIVFRILKIMRTDVAASLTLVDRALKDSPKDQGLRHLKAMALASSEKPDEAIKLWQELASDEKPFAPALLRLADMHWDVEAPEKMKQAVDYYIRYGRLEPEDPRTPAALASLYEGLKDDAAAESQHRVALKADPEDEDQYVEFAAFLSKRKRFSEAVAVLDEAPRGDQEGNDLFGDLLRDLYYSDEKEALEELAYSQPQRTERSAVANLYLGYVLSENGKSLRAIPLFKKAAAARKDWSEPYEAMAQSYRNLRNWRAAIKAADTAIALQEDSSTAYFYRACALARLRRTKEAMYSLEKAVELDPELREYLAEESDLKILASRPAFKKLLVVPADQ